MSEQTEAAARISETRASILYGELWQQTHYGTMRVDEAREQIIRWLMSDWFADRTIRTAILGSQAALVEQLTEALREHSFWLAGRVLDSSLSHDAALVRAYEQGKAALAAADAQKSADARREE